MFSFGQRVCLILVQKSSSEAIMTALLNDTMKKKAKRKAAKKAAKKRKSRLNDADSMEVDSPRANSTSPPPSAGRIVGHYVLKLEYSDLTSSKLRVSP